MTLLKRIALSILIGMTAISLVSQETSLQRVPSLSAASHQAFADSLMADGITRWDKAFLIHLPIEVAADKPAVMLYDNNGSLVREATVWFADSSEVSTTDAAVSESGTLFVSGGAADSKGAIAHFVASVDKSGKLDQIVRTSPFVPVHICSAADDGTVWVYGFDREADGREKRQGAMLRQYSLRGGLQTALLDRAEMNQDNFLVRGAYPAQVFLRCTQTKIALYQGSIGELFEYDLANKQLTTVKVAPLPSTVRLAGSAFMKSGELLSALHDQARGAGLTGLFRLERNKSTGIAKWTAVIGTLGKGGAGPIGRLYGNDGDLLVYTKDGTPTLYWSSIQADVAPAH